MVNPYIVGAMERGSEIIREETKKAEDLVDNSIKMWTEMGLPVFRARKKQRRELETVADFLSNKGFSNDQISEAMRQGKHTAVVDHVTAMEKMGQGYNAADIITFADANYQDTGRTMDQVLDGVMGKVKKGMSLTDAIADSTGKDIGGIQGAIMKRRAGAVKTAFGIDPTEFRSLAREDFEYGDNLGGKITLTDPVAAAKAAQAMEGKTTGMTNVETTRDAMFDFGADLVGGKEQITSSGIIYSFEQPGRRVELNQKIASLVSDKEKEVGRSAFNAADRTDIQTKLYDWAVSNEYYTPPAQQAETETTAAASALDTIKAGMRTNTSWLERGQGRQELVQKLATAIVEAGLATDDTAISEAYAIIFDTEKQIKEAQAAAAAANTGSDQNINSDFSGGA
tara:strand:+ start:1636 stop:2826 length:1191 start_codon:yes stop_codon:yes gene_type:complete